VKSVAIAHSIQKAPDNKFGDGIFIADGSEVASASLGNVPEIRTGGLAMMGTLRHSTIMPTAKQLSRERRWIVLGEDGRHVSLGRHTDPTSDEVALAEEALRRSGQAGWLAIMDGNPYTGGMPQLMMVRPLSSPSEAWEKAVSSFERLQEQQKR
jgi:hypothetical protein